MARKLAVIKERVLKGQITASSVTFVVKGEEVASRLVSNSLRAMGKLHQVENYDEARPDAMCGNCCGWGHIETQCVHWRKPKCALCAAENRTELYRCPVEGCGAAGGIHVMAKSPNCKGPHRTWSSQCPKRV